MKALHFRRWGCALWVVVGCATGALQAQTIYRCGNSYSDTPCAQAVAIPTADARTPGQKAQSEEATARAATLAAQLEKTRRADEAAAQKRAQAGAPAAPPAAKSQGHAAPENSKNGGKHKKSAGEGASQANPVRLSKPKKPEGFTVKVPAPVKPKP